MALILSNYKKIINHKPKKSLSEFNSFYLNFSQFLSFSLLLLFKTILAMINYSQTKFSSKMSRWTQQQTVIYIRFLKRNLHKIIHKNNKKFLIFKKMAQQIQTKTPGQCRSHHQKIMNKYKTIENFIDGVIPDSFTSQISQIPGKIELNSSQQNQGKLEIESIQTDENLCEEKIKVKQDWKLQWETDENIFDVLQDVSFWEE